MRKIIILAIIAGAILGGLAILDFFGYYFDWKRPIFLVAIGAPLIQFVFQAFQRPEKDLSSGESADKSSSSVRKQMSQLAKDIKIIKNKIN